jgi:hypothetical protein
MGIRTPDLLHGMRGGSVRHRRAGSDTGRSGRPELSGCVRLSLVQAEPVVAWLVTGLRHHSVRLACRTSLLNSWLASAGWLRRRGGRREAGWECLSRRTSASSNCCLAGLSASGNRSGNGACEVAGSPGARRDAHRRLWTDVVSRAQPGYVAAPASLAFTALQGGDGALANIALERALADTPDTR